MSFELAVQKLVYGGEALGHYQGRAVLVPFALPGERLEVEEVRTAKGVTHARPLQVIAPAPERIAPPCPYFARCGGCQYQHLDATHQSAWKREILRETLRRIGKISWDAEIRTHTAHAWNYRNQAQLKISRQADDHVALGFFEAESHRLVPVDECMILSPRLNGLLRELGGERSSEWLAECTEIEMLADDRDDRVMMTVRCEVASEKAQALGEFCLKNLSAVECAAVESHGRRTVFGQPALEYAVGEFRYRVSPGSFFQASRFLLLEFVHAVTRDVAGSLALDLYAGVGLFTLPLAHRFEQVVGVEGNRQAAADLKSNASAHELKNLRAAGENTYDFLRRFAQSEPDLIVVDPPRAGVGKPSLELLARLRPARVHYVSCHPPTLARDLAFLTSRGFTLNSIEMFDFFPQTFHIECLAKLTRSERAGS